MVGETTLSTASLNGEGEKRDTGMRPLIGKAGADSAD